MGATLAVRVAGDGAQLHGGAHGEQKPENFVCAGNRGWRNRCRLRSSRAALKARLDRKKSREDVKTANPQHHAMRWGGVKRGSIHAGIQGQRKQRTNIRKRVKAIRNFAASNARPPNLKQRTCRAENEKWKTNRETQIENTVRIGWQPFSPSKDRRTTGWRRRQPAITRRDTP